MIFTDKVRRAVATRRRWCWSAGLISFMGASIFTEGNWNTALIFTGMVVAVAWSITTDTIKREEAAREL